MYNPLNGNLDFQQQLDKVKENYALSELLSEIFRLFQNNNFSSQKLDELLDYYNVSHHQLEFEIINFITAFCETILDDQQIDKSEIENLTFVKMTFKIKEGELYRNKKDEIDQIIRRQFLKINEDAIISDDEEIFSLEMQGLFDLSYDTYQQIINKE